MSKKPQSSLGGLIIFFKIEIVSFSKGFNSAKCSEGHTYAMPKVSSR